MPFRLPLCSTAVSSVAVQTKDRQGHGETFFFSGLQEKPQAPAANAEVPITEVKKDPKAKGRSKRRKAEAEPEVVCINSDADNDEVEYVDPAAPTSNGHTGAPLLVRSIAYAVNVSEVGFLELKSWCLPVPSLSSPSRV